MALIVSGSSLGAGIIDISNDEGFTFQVYCSGTVANIIGDDRDVSVWMTGAMANIQWSEKIPNIPISEGTSRYGWIYPISSGISDDETDIQFDFVSGGDIGWNRSQGSLAFVGGYLFVYTYNGIANSVIQKIGVLDGSTEGKTIYLPYRLMKFAALDANTIYGEFYTGAYVDTNSLYKIDFITETVTRLYTYNAEDEEYGADGEYWIRYSDIYYGWATIAKYQDKKYYISLNQADGYQEYARFFVYDIVNEHLVSNDFIEFNNIADYSRTSSFIDAVTRPAFYNDKVAFTLCAYSSGDEDDEWPPTPSWELPFPTIVFNMTTETVTRVSAGPATDFDDWFYDMMGSAVDKDTGLYYFAIWDENRRDIPGDPFCLYRMDLDNPSQPTLIYTAMEGGGPGGFDTNGFTVYNGSRNAYVMTNDGRIMEMPSFTPTGNMTNPYFIWQDLLFDESTDMVWAVNAANFPSNDYVDAQHVYGYGIHGGTAKTIHLNHIGQVYYYEYNRRCYFLMLARGVCVVHLYSTQNASVPLGAVQNTFKIFKKRAT